MLHGHIANNKLTNHSTTINDSEVSLGGSLTLPDTDTTYTSGRINLDGTTFRARCR